MRKVLLALALALSLAACGKKLPTPPPPPPGQNDTTRVVLAEMFSSRWCSNCPQADAAIHDLYEAYGPSRLIVVEYHPRSFGGPDSLGTPETDARIRDYFGTLRTLPQCLFGGLHRTEGAPLTTMRMTVVAIVMFTSTATLGSTFTCAVASQMTVPWPSRPS